MKAITASALRKNLAKYLDGVAEDGDVIIIPRNTEEGDGKGVVLIPLEEYELLDETTRILANPAEAASLRRAIRNAESGATVVHAEGLAHAG